MKPIIEIQNGVPRHPLYRMKEPVNFCMLRGEQLAIVGPNAGGKSLLVDIITGRWPLLMNEVKYDFSPSASPLACDNIKYITFRDSYGDSDANYYYQQRWNSQDLETTPIVGDLLPPAQNPELKETLYQLFGIPEMLSKHIVLLSSGELRKFQLTKTLLAGPRVLILDNPFIGLDARTRELLQQLLQQLITLMQLQVILVLSKTDDIPSFITHVVPVDDIRCGGKITLDAYLHTCPPAPGRMLTAEKEQRLLSLPTADNQPDADEVVRLHQVSIRYGQRTILSELDWTVHRGEKWALSGANGSGKSTLLSLVCADNPQSYACDISLFGYKRGSGESIWDIKKHIGYVSPEMHRAYHRDIKALKIVASGLSDTVGLYMKPDEEQTARCLFWMNVFGVGDKAETSFLKMSDGEQRLVLLARAFVKDPELLILDEPLHGLDDRNRRLVKDVINAFCERENKTLVMVTHYKSEYPECINKSKFLIKNK